MKIIFSTYEAKEIGGSYLRSLSLAQELVKLGHEVTLWTSAKHISVWPKISYENGVRVIESIGLLPYRFRKGGYDIFDIILRTAVVMWSQADIVQSFNHRPAATFPFLSRKILRPQTQWWLDWADLWGKGGIADRRYGRFSFITKNVDHYLEKLMIRLPDAVTPISDDLVKKAIHIRGSKKNIFFLGVGANIADIKPLNKKVARQKVKLLTKEKDKILAYLYVGTYDEELLADTFIQLCQLRTDVRLLLLGPELPAFEQLMLKHPQVSKRVLRCGVVPRELLGTYLSAADLMMLPFAHKEINLGKFPNKLGDYLAVGRPIAANPTGEVEKLFNQAQMAKTPIGILASENPPEFAQAIDKLLNNSKKMKRLGKNARIVAQKMSWLSVAQQLEGFYLK